MYRRISVSTSLRVCVRARVPMYPHERSGRYLTNDSSPQQMITDCALIIIRKKISLGLGGAGFFL